MLEFYVRIHLKFIAALNLFIVLSCTSENKFMLSKNLFFFST